jgi:hypothetical protein
LCLGQSATIIRVCLDVDPNTRKQLLLISTQAIKEILYLLFPIDTTAWLHIEHQLTGIHPSLLRICQTLFQVAHQCVVAIPRTQCDEVLLGDPLPVVALDALHLIEGYCKLCVHSLDRECDSSREREH